MSTEVPHLTPASLIGRSFDRKALGEVRFALMGCCPGPSVLSQYDPKPMTEQYFIHVPPYSVTKCAHAGVSFLSLVHIYGGPVCAATVEELAYYGVDYVLAYGLAGGLGTRGLKVGDYYLVESALACDGTTPHYTRDPIVQSDAALNRKIVELAAATRLEKIHPVRAVTGDAIYRELDSYLDSARQQGCDIVNLDCSHLFAVARRNHERREIKTTLCGLLTDVARAPGEPWDSTLSEMLSGESSSLLDLTGEIVRFYVETLLPALAR